MSLRVLFVFALLAGSSFSATADSVDDNLSRDRTEARYYSHVGFIKITLGALHNDNRNKWAAHNGPFAMGESNRAGSRPGDGYGGKVYAVSIGSADALALGGQFRLAPGNGSFGAGGSGFHAPGVWSVMDSERFRDVGVRAEVELVRHSFLYVGYREIRAEFDNQAKVNIDKGSFVGIQVKF